MLSSQKDPFEAAYGRGLEWESLPNARASRVADYRADAVITDEDEWPAFIDWLVDAGVRIRRALDSIDISQPFA